LVPLHATWQVDINAWLLPALAVLGGYYALAPRLFRVPGLSRRSLLAIAIVLFVVIAVSVSMVDGYWTVRGQTLPAVIAPYARTWVEYYHDVPKVDEVGGPTAFLRKFSKPTFFERLSRHTRTHPPGGVLFLWGAGRLFGHSLWSAALASIAFASLAALGVYGLARELTDESTARLALALHLVTPNVVMFSATSMDGPFSVFPVFSLFAFFRALGRPAAARRGYGSLCGACLFLASYLTYASVVVAAFLVLVALFELGGDRRRLGAMLEVLAIAAATVLACYGALAVLGYDPVAAVKASVAFDEGEMGSGHETLTRYLLLSLSNLVAFLAGTGLPVTALWIRELRSSIRQRRPRGLLGSSVIAFATTLVAASFSTLFTLEVERIWLFLTPLLVVPAARQLATAGGPATGRASARCALGLLVLQLLLAEVTLRTDW
jgi:4-amino-4-deoxy-L-arabinose transferase-like glycosyltransferase